MPRKISLEIALTLLILGQNVLAIDNYKKYDRSPEMEDYITISFNDDLITLTIYGDDTTAVTTFSRGDINRSESGISIKGQSLLTADGFIIGNHVYSPDQIDDVSISTEENKTDIYFRKRSESSSNQFRNRRKNLITSFEQAIVSDSDFIRGAVVGLGADIKIDGEVNEDVISLFGNIEIDEKAVIRGDIIALDGQVKADRGATIYGGIIASGNKGRIRLGRHQFWHDGDKEFYPIFKFDYNRVDGATPHLGIGFASEDSSLPRIEIYAGYGFSSESWRYVVDLEQSFFIPQPLTIGGTIYKRLASDDDWIISDLHNTIFALLATEDYKDFYETEGGYGFIRSVPVNNLQVELGIRIEKYHWLDAHGDLWSMFGGSKRFPENYASISGPDRSQMINQLDRAEVSALIGRFDYDNSRDQDKYETSFWKGYGEVEWLPGEWNDDFVYTRYRIRLGHYQVVSRQTGLYLGAVYGHANGNLPINKIFYIGGINTLLGYRHKEFYGNEFWLGDIEYAIRFPNTDLTGWLFYNIGQMAKETGKLGDAEVKNSLGIGLSLGDNIRLDLAKRLDRSDSTFKIHVRLGLNF
nr:BamA/TamA family outer membrane protein [candidate division Zixibacteria bacterium]